MAEEITRLSAEHLVVGAGAAGCTLGWLLRQAGREVLALELHDARDKEKLCGGILGVRSLVELRDAFGKEGLDELAPTFPPHQRTGCLDREHVVRCRYATIERRRLDDWLLARYLSSGGTLLDRVRLVAVDTTRHVATCIDLRTNERLEVSYGTLVGADGASSAVRRLVTGRRQRVVASCEGKVPRCREDVIFSNRLGSQGYCWYIPTGDTANVGCMSYSEDARERREWLAEFCESLGVALPELRGAPIPTGDDVLLEAAEDVWLVGDAAGLASPIDGGGIHFALMSARMLATSLLGGEPYEKAMRAVAKLLSADAERRAMRYLLLNTATVKRGVPWS